MDAKSSIPSSSYEEEEESFPPPTYAESQISGHHPHHASSHDMKKNPIPEHHPTTHQTYSSQIQQQLSDLTHSMATIQTQRTLLTTAQDEKILNLLTHEISTYLAAFAASGLRAGQLILIPAAALREEERASPMSCDVDDPTAFNRFARVIDEENRKLLADHDRARREYGYGFDEEVRADLWFWDDEKMARRLAGCLRPEQRTKIVTVPMELPPRPLGGGGDADGERKSRWGWKRKKQDVVEEPVRPVEIVQPREDNVAMDIRGQEVCFEVENDCGVLESRSGYGIVMKLSVAMFS